MGKNNLGMNQITLQQLLPNTDQLLKLDELIRSYKTTMPMLDTMSNSTIIQNALRMVQILSSTFQLLSTIDMGEIQTFLEEGEVQEEIQQEIISIQEETSVKNVMDIINDWALKIMNAPTTLKEKAPAVYLFLCIVLPLMDGNYYHLPFKISGKRRFYMFHNLQKRSLKKMLNN
ncbi:hypothetical protein [Bacillus cereus]|uniref:hypothetical protein n=1 Tax=Bacillus cereus TaxID=1396 RepID=UPI001D0D104F|nr:hypothetical protein [Bacillus cereus]